jgi:glycosyltransferase involved in cell wall biosynthesis/tetratricopeptide (TPR) repeat protein
LEILVRTCNAFVILSAKTNSALADLRGVVCMLGEKHKAIADWLVDKWNSDKNCVCVIEGFSGVGKTEVASEFERRTSLDARVDAPESGSLDDLMLDLAEQLAATGHGELASAINSGGSTETAFANILLKPVRIVIDEFQRMVDTNNGTPFPHVAALIERVSNRAAPGRLLLLSHHSLDKTHRWGERVSFKTLDGLSEKEGAQLLSQLLAERGREADILPERRTEISRWLGGNARAIRVLVGCLEQEALEDLTGVVPEAWEARDQLVSQSLILKLERELLVRALQKLDGASASALEQLAVFRKAVNKEGLSRMLSQGLQVEHFLSALSSRFLIEQRAGRYSLNPIVREISLHRLKEKARSTLVAHRTAAGYYTRHFKAKQIENAGALGGVFVEARYHLVQSNDLAELSQISQRFGGHLRSLYGWTTPESNNDGHRDEVIGVLSAYLQDEGPKAMVYHLARLLYSRGRPEDHKRALVYARRSTGPQSPADAWVLRFRLEAEVAGITEMMDAARLGFATVHADANLFALYWTAVDQLRLVGRATEALDLLRDGISKVGPDKGLYSLYTMEADLLASAGDIDEAILSLRQGLTIIPAENNLFLIYQKVTRLLVMKGSLDDAIDLLKDGIARIPVEYSLVRLYLALARTLLFDANRKEDAIIALEEGLLRIPTGRHRTLLQSALRRILKTNVATRNTNSGGPISGEPSAVPTSGSTGEVKFSSNQFLCILAVGTEWESRHGGLSTFNRTLCIELAAAGHKVVCIVPDATQQERNDAERDNVYLLTPVGEPGLEGEEKLLLNTPLPVDFNPALVIGHDRKTGPHAKVLADRFGAKFVLFVHTRTEDIEWHKDKFGQDDAATNAESRRNLQQQLASSAALVVGVGPLLAANAQSLVYLSNPKPIVHRLDPGFRAVQRPSHPPPEIFCLLLGRAEDFKLKGLDIAARAMGEVTRRNKLESIPRLIVRGAPVGTGQALRDQLVGFSGNGKLNIEVRDYSPHVERLMNDILMASVVLMPSRSEGFGLVALEAIAANTPVLVSDRSGLATLLRERLGKNAENMIVETHEDIEFSAQEWARSIETVLIDRNAAFARALSQQKVLAETLDWKDAISQLEVAWKPLFA